MRGVYAILNMTNGKMYVGSAVDVGYRWRKHRECLDRGSHHSIKLQNAWRKYGADAFTWRVVEVLDDAAQLVPREQFWLDYFNTVRRGYNVCPTAGSRLGSRQSEETKRKIAEAGRGRTHTAESRQRISQTKLENPSATQRLAAIASNKRRTGQRHKHPMSAEHRRKIADALKGKVRSPEHCRKISEGKRRNMTDETRRKMSEAAKLRHKRRLASLDTSID